MEKAEQMPGAGWLLSLGVKAHGHASIAAGTVAAEECY